MTTFGSRFATLRGSFMIAGIATLATLLGACSSHAGSDAAVDGNALPSSAQRLRFNEKGEAARPVGYRSWVHAYSAWESIAVTILDGTVTKTPEFHNVYVEPETYRLFMKTGKWPEGSLMVKEFSSVNTDPEQCEGPPGFLCPFGTSKVILQQERMGIGVMLKDSKRFPNEPGGWAYFSFGHKTPPYEPFSPPRPRTQCAQCHIDEVGPKDDYVWSVKLNQPGFRREVGDIADNLSGAFPN
ncbi:cytochrome P460 family protein [Luteimonas salinilitoris]|uniref:Cytochrome P460 family protein n=1 Tax=Luteimonas salinilitoris TaxID=3237697 RepID=A0ABV4HRA4_9GAMM